jgi:hypothetical protein
MIRKANKIGAWGRAPAILQQRAGWGLAGARPQPPSAAAAALLALLVTVLAGCGGTPPLPDEYGQRQSPRGGGSVNGLSVLADMFQENGHRISVWKRLSPKIRQSDVIIWAPDSFEPPSVEARRFLEAWLNEEDDRTLVYIGRDYDAAVHYWSSVLPGAPPEQAEAVQRRLARARSDFDDRRAAQPGKQYARWFTHDATLPRRDVRQLSGQWLDEINGEQFALDPAKVEIELGARLRIPVDEITADDEGALEFAPLLESGADVLAYRITFSEDYLPEPGPEVEEPAEIDTTWAPDDDYYYEDPGPSNGQILVVANGSFLLNLPLVNHQHRLLAGKLVEECETGFTMQVAVLESGESVQVFDEEPKPISYLEMLRTWPISFILLHALGLGVLFCFVFFPIFGRPIERSLLRVEQGVPIYVSIGSQSAGPSDFGKHIEALGEMMARTQEQQYAQARLQHYQQHVKRDSGASHRGEAKKR